MGRYKEYRAPQGNPADNEQDAWFDGGALKFGHYVAASDTWVEDASVDSGDLTGQEVVMDSWHVVGAAEQPAFESGWITPGGSFSLKFKKVDGFVYIAGIAKGGSNPSGSTIFTLPEGYRPSTYLSVRPVRFYDSSASTHTEMEFNVATSGAVGFVSWPELNDLLTFYNAFFPL